jgi:hypothetical protein
MPIARAAAGLQINDAPAHERTSIIDPHHHGATVDVICDRNVGAEWQRR